MGLFFEISELFCWWFLLLWQIITTETITMFGDFCKLPYKHNKSKPSNMEDSEDNIHIYICNIYNIYWHVQVKYLLIVELNHIWWLQEIPRGWRFWRDLERPFQAAMNIYWPEWPDLKHMINGCKTDATVTRFSETKRQPIPQRVMLGRWVVLSGKVASFHGSCKGWGFRMRITSAERSRTRWKQQR